MSKKSRRSNWFTSLRRQPPPRRPSARPAESQEFVVETPVDELMGRRQQAAQSSTLVPEAEVQRFEQPEFSAVNHATLLQEKRPQPTEPAVPTSSVPFKQRVERKVRSSLSRGKQASVNGVLATKGFAQAQAVNAYEGIKPVVKRHRFGLLSLGLLTTASVTAIGSILWLTRVPPAPECDKINILSSDSERLYCAQQAARSGDPEKILAAMQLVQSWSKDHPMYPQATSALAQWSDDLLVSARQKLEQNDLDGALALAKQVPEMSPLYDRAQAAINFWQFERNRGQQLFEKIQTALRRQYWGEASGLLAKLALVDDASWRDRMPNLRKQLNDERKAGKFLKDAKTFAKKHPPEQLGKAMQIMLPMNRQTFVWQAAQKQIQAWRDTLVKLAAKQFTANKIQSANQILASLPNEVSLTNVQRDLVRVTRAANLSAMRQNQAPVLHQLWGLMVADAGASQIDPASPYYKQAQKLQPKLDIQAQDAVQIEMARVLANFGQVPALDMAMQQVARVNPKRPRRIQAQTLLASWRKQSQALEDRPILRQAEILAEAGGLGRLRQAVKLADRIPKGRPIYARMQSQKGAWVKQIQTIEDKPILNEARSLAQSGNLSKAIKTARRIQRGRALHGEARKYIWEWGDQLQAIVDRNRLARANALASQGSLTRAINLASSISSSAVSGEARQSINRWAAERDAIVRARQPDPPAPRYEAPTRRYEPERPRYSAPPRAYTPAPVRRPAPAPVVRPAPAPPPPAPAPLPPAVVDPAPPADPVPPQ